jgi:hypothetical protein
MTDFFLLAVAVFLAVLAVRALTARWAAPRDRARDR